MTNAFVAYASEDREFVKEIIFDVEQHGHNLWHYERDSLPATVYMEEIPKEIQSSDIVIVIASRASLDSHQVTREMQLSHEQKKKFLPILYGITHDEIVDLQPSWATALGATTCLCWEAAGKQKLIKSIVRALDAIAPPRRAKPVRWAADASLIGIPNLNRVLFQTDEIEAFLNGDHQFFISANKGVGKTLLLKAKRAQLMKEHSETTKISRAQVQFIPESTPYLDSTTSEWPSINKDHVKLLSTLRSCRRLWSFALRTSILSHFPEHFEKLNSETFTSLARRPIDEILHPRTSATVIFKDLLNTLTVTQINKLLDKMEANVEYAFRGIHSAVFMFIDRVEQGVSSLSQRAWINAQAGLIEAAADVMNSNNHVKVYASIREEAYANYQSDSKLNLYTAVLNLRYDLAELQHMMDRLCLLYEGQPTFHQFAGRRTVRNIPCRVEEDSFRYVHRHTVGRPRDIVVLCSEISSRRSNQSELAFRNTVNEVSSNLLLPLIFEEHAVFLECLNRVDERNRFFSLLPSNVLTRPQIERICCEFNRVEAAHYSELTDADCSLAHPFCELYNCGLIGVVREDTVNNATIQEFKQPYDVVGQCESCLPPADYYLLHPSLQLVIQKQRRRPDYRVFQFIAVGHGYKWHDYFGEMIDVQRAVFDITDRVLSQMVIAFIESVLSDTNEYAVPDSQELRSFDQLQSELETANYDDVYLHLERFVEAIKVSSNVT